MACGDCKKIELYRDFRPSSGGVIAGSGSYVHPPEYQETGTAFEQELSGTHTFRRLSAELRRTDSEPPML
jgi:hypothetical protein